MKNILKTALIAAGGLGLSFAAQVAEATSLTVVVDKIQVIEDADDYTKAITIFQPSANIGESATRTIDLFDATQKLGTGLNVANPGTGTYETVCIFFEQINLVSTYKATGTADTDLTSTFNTLGVTDPFAGQQVMCLGEAGTGGSSVGTVLGNTPAGSLQPVTVSGSNFSMPKLNIEIETTAVQDVSGTAPTLTKLPTISTVSVASLDNTDVPNLQLVVDHDAAFDGQTGYVSGTTNVTVGIFADQRPLAERPIAYTVYTTSGSSEATKTVTLYDVPSATSVIPVAWIDADSDYKLDAGELVAVSSTTIANAVVNLTVFAQDSDGNVSPTEILDTLGGVAPRTISLTLEAATVASATAAGDCAATADTVGYSGVEFLLDPTNAAVSQAQCGAETETSLTIVYSSYYTGSACTVGAVSRTIGLAGRLGENNDDNNVVDAEDVTWLIDGDSQFDDLSGVTFSTSSTDISGSIVVTGIPVCPTLFATDNTASHYDVEFRVSIPSTEGVAAANEAAANVTTQATQALNAVGDNNTIVYRNGGTIDVGTID